MARRLGKRANKKIFRSGYNKVVSKNLHGPKLVRGGSRL